MQRYRKNSLKFHMCKSHSVSAGTEAIINIFKQNMKHFIHCSLILLYEINQKNKFIIGFYLIYI